MNAAEIPSDGYWRVTDTSIFCYPLVTVFANSGADADAIAKPGPRDVHTYIELSMDSAMAQERLGIFGKPEMAAQIMRGEDR